jgi:hypothetical protein
MANQRFPSPGHVTEGSLAAGSLMPGSPQYVVTWNDLSGPCLSSHVPGTMLEFGWLDIIASTVHQDPGHVPFIFQRMTAFRLNPYLALTMSQLGNDETQSSN